MTTHVPARAGDKESAFHVSTALDLLGGCVDRYRGFWIGLGRLESALLVHELRAIPLTMPVYVCGLARSGSTLLHEIVAAHRGVATHRVKDYPMVFTPFWWRQAIARQKPAPPRERAHRDRVMISPESPDALEEMLWMAFFPRCHDVRFSHLLTEDDRHPGFEALYRSHLKKLLLSERAGRYVAKANYHVARLPYLLRLIPDARFLLPVRSPITHVASLLRQQRWFSQGQRQHPRALAFMRRSGHFEFGLDRRPMNLGQREAVQRILDAWAIGDEVRGLARYWDMTYAYLARLLDSDARVKSAALVVRFERLCAAPAETIGAVRGHCRLAETEGLVERFAGRIRLPDYYESPLSDADVAVIREETAATAGWWGY
jgi:hypothetical protein